MTSTSYLMYKYCPIALWTTVQTSSSKSKIAPKSSDRSLCVRYIQQWCKYDIWVVWGVWASELSQAIHPHLYIFSLAFENNHFSSVAQIISIYNMRHKHASTPLTVSVSVANKWLVLIWNAVFYCDIRRWRISYTFIIYNLSQEHDFSPFHSVSPQAGD